MIEDEPMTPLTWAILMPMTDQPKWGAKWGIVSLVANFDEGTWLDGPELAELTGVKWARRNLSELVDARVLDCDDGGGGHQRWYRVNPRWWQWRIRWSQRCEVHADDAPASLAACAACRREVDRLLSVWAQRATEPAIDRFISRAGRAFARTIARLDARYRGDAHATKALMAVQSRARAREISNSGGNAEQISRAMPRDLPSNRAARRAILEGGPKEEEVLNKRSAEGTPPATIAKADLGRARRALLGIAIPGRGHNRPWLAGESRNRVCRLVAEYGIDAFEAGCRRLEADTHPVPLLIEQLADLLAEPAPTPDLRPVAADPAAATRERLDQQRSIQPGRALGAVGRWREALEAGRTGTARDQLVDAWDAPVSPAAQASA